jgi:hypothetical protein
MEKYRVVDIRPDPEVRGAELVTIRQIDWDTKKVIPGGLEETVRRD